jgi:hypothetical protein
MIGSAFVALLAGGGCTLAAITQVACARNTEEIEASRRLYRLGAAFTTIGIVLIVVAIVGGEG